MSPRRKTLILIAGKSGFRVATRFVTSPEESLKLCNCNLTGYPGNAAVGAKVVEDEILQIPAEIH